MKEIGFLRGVPAHLPFGQPGGDRTGDRTDRQNLQRETFVRNFI